MQLFEKGPGIKEGLRDIRFNKHNLSQFLVSLVFSLTGAVVVMVNVGEQAGFTPNQTTSFIAFSYVMAGIVSVFMTLYYKVPLVAMSSMTSMIVVGREFANFTVNEIVGSFIITSIALVVLGLSGVFSKLTGRLPMPILMGMLAGTYMSYGTGLVDGVQGMPLIGLITVGVYLVSPLILKKVPRQAVAVVVALVLTFVLVPADYSFGDLMFKPELYPPAFHPGVLLNLCVPMILLIFSDTLITFAILKTNGYEKPPADGLLTLPAISSLIGCFGLTVPATMAGINASMLSGPENGPIEKRYVGAVLKGLSSVGIGVLASFLVPVLLVMPGPMKNVLAGLAMLSLFFAALGGAFGGKKFKHGAFAAFIITLSGFTLYGVSSAIWSLVIGLVVSFFMERKDFAQTPPPAKDAPVSAEKAKA